MGKEKFKDMTEQELKDYIAEKERERTTYRKKSVPRARTKAEVDAKELADLAKSLGLTAEDMKELQT